MDFNQRIGARLKEAREDAGLTQADVAEFLDLQRASYTQIEIGDNALRIEYLPKLSKIFNKPVAWFLGIPSNGLTSQEDELLYLFRSLPIELDREFFLDTLRRFARSRSRMGGG